MPQGDTQADLTERARDPDDQAQVIVNRWLGNADHADLGYKELQKLIAAALQSEREAAAAEARKFRDMFNHLKQKAEIAGREDTLKVMREIEAAYALASPPAPQEDYAPGEVTQRWRRHHPQLPIVARDE